MRVLMVDNYDSFTYNLVQYLGEMGCELEVVRNDRADVDDLVGRGYDRVVVSPGPCTPNEAGISLEVVKRFPEARVPTLGVCLGHQSLAQAFGGEVVRHVPVHGKATVIEAGRKFKVLAENKLEDGFMASPAVAGKALLLRTKTHLYRIENPDAVSEK